MFYGGEAGVRETERERERWRADAATRPSCTLSQIWLELYFLNLIPLPSDALLNCPLTILREVITIVWTEKSML